MLHYFVKPHFVPFVDFCYVYQILYMFGVSFIVSTSKFYFLSTIALISSRSLYQLESSPKFCFNVKLKIILLQFYYD